MTAALNYIYEIFDYFLEFVFNGMEFFNNVTFGWVCIACLIFGLLIRSILQVPNRIHGNIKVNSLNRSEGYRAWDEGQNGFSYRKRRYF